jgi:hypothetical protein
MERPSKPTSIFSKDSKNIKFLDEYQLNFNTINYLIKIGIIMESKELAIFAKEENINEYYYQNCFSLEYFHNKNKMFKLFDKIEEIIDALKDIISNKTLTIKKEEGNEELSIILKVKILGKGEEEIKLTLTKKNEKTEIIINNLKAKIDDLESEAIKRKNETEIIIKNLEAKIADLESEVIKLKNENKSIKVKKYKPILENGWQVDPSTPQEFIVCKNTDGQVSFQGAVSGDWSKKIFTLEKEYRTKYRLTFPIIANQAFNRVDILPNGDVYLSCHASLGIKGSGWANLSGVTYYISE